MKQGTSRVPEQHFPVSRVPERERIIANIAYLMGDVTDSLMLDAQFYVRAAGYDLKQRIKQRWRRAVEATAAARRAWKEFATDMYDPTHADTVEGWCNDSDWYADIILLIADRTGDDPQRRDMVRRYLLRLRSELHIYKKEK